MLVAVIALCACVPMPERPAISTLGCAQAVVSNKVPQGLADKPTHCIATALVARYCSRTEARLVSVGKEVKDLFSAGDAEWADLQADRLGLQCAEKADDDAGVGECCRAATARLRALRN